MWRSLPTSVLYFSPFFTGLLTVSLFEVLMLQINLPTGSHSHRALSESVFIITVLIKALSLVPSPTKPKPPSMMLKAPHNIISAVLWVAIHLIQPSSESSPTSVILEWRFPFACMAMHECLKQCTLISDLILTYQSLNYYIYCTRCLMRDMSYFKSIHHEFKSFSPSRPSLLLLMPPFDIQVYSRIPSQHFFSGLFFSIATVQASLPETWIFTTAPESSHPLVLNANSCCLSNGYSSVDLLSLEYRLVCVSRKYGNVVLGVSVMSILVPGIYEQLWGLQDGPSMQVYSEDHMSLLGRASLNRHSSQARGSDPVTLL